MDAKRVRAAVALAAVALAAGESGDAALSVRDWLTEFAA